MKVDLIKETRRNGQIWYCIYVNNSYVNSYLNLIEAKSHFDDIKSEETKEILQTKEI